MSSRKSSKTSRTSKKEALVSTRTRKRSDITQASPPKNDVCLTCCDYDYADEENNTSSTWKKVLFFVFCVIVFGVGIFVLLKN